MLWDNTKHTWASIIFRGCVTASVFVGNCLPLHLPNGTVSYDMDSVLHLRRVSYPQNTTVTFTCNYGDPLDGDTSATCEASGNWSHPVPTCIGNEQDLIFLLFQKTYKTKPL